MYRFTSDMSTCMYREPVSASGVSSTWAARVESGEVNVVDIVREQRVGYGASPYFLQTSSGGRMREGVVLFHIRGKLLLWQIQWSIASAYPHYILMHNTSVITSSNRPALTPCIYSPVGVCENWSRSLGWFKFYQCKKLSRSNYEAATV